MASMNFRVNDLEEVETLIRAGGASGVGAGGRRSKSTSCQTSQGGRCDRRWLIAGCLVAVFVIFHLVQARSGTNDSPEHQTGFDDVPIQFIDPDPPTDSPQKDTPTPPKRPTGEVVTIGPPEKEQTKPPETVTKPKRKPRNSKIATIEPDLEAGPIDEDKRAALSEKWESWYFWDGDEDMRPSEDYLADYPYHDIPGDKFPDRSWQTDSVYVNHFLNDAGNLIERAMESIFTEYGHGKPLPPEELAARFKMFHWEKIDLSNATEPPPEFRRHGARDIGGWTTKRSFDGLVRRLLHAMLTRDTFTVVLAGHSAAQGEGNHFRQSYAMQFHRIMKPIFERLGVKLITRNISQGGLGTLQGGMGARDIYGSEIDLFLWDSGMTEGGSLHHVDLVIRQVLMSGNRVPIVWGAPFDLLKLYHEKADVDVGEWGNGYAGIPETVSKEQSLTLPFAARNIKCASGKDSQDLCNENRFSSTCWINRSDGIVPARAQLERPRGQVKWHPGWRAHQLMGRVLAFSVMEGIEVAINNWMHNTMTGQPLDDEYWHVSEYYENIRNKIRSMDQSLGYCANIANNTELPLRMCSTPMNARTQYTPRANFEESSLTSILKPAPSGYVPIPGNRRPPLYEGPDVHNPAYDIPEGEIDVLSIIMGRRRRLNNVEEESTSNDEAKDASSKLTLQARRRRLDDDIVPGEGWDVALEVQGYCDGAYDSVCAHSPDEECFLIGHHDGRGAVVGGDRSGWLVMTLKALKEGIIVVKLHTWHVAEENPRARDWSTVNGKTRYLGDSAVSEDDNIIYVDDLAYPEVDELPVSYQHRRAKHRNYDCPPLPDSFAFDYAINGKVTSLNRTEFLARKKNLQRVVETMTLMDDPDFTKEAQDVDVAFRLRDSGRDIVFGISHIYWA